MKGKRAKVLIVDDEQLNIELIEAMLSPQYDVIAAYNGKEALKKVNQVHPDIVLLDILMPGISGYEVCRRLKENKETSIIPVVMITALKEKEEKIKAIEVGADDFLTKPVDKTEVVARVKSLIRVKYLYDELIHINTTLEQQVKEQVEKLRHTIEEKERLLKLAAIGELAAGVAHEIRNPLGGIRLLVEGLRDQLGEKDSCRVYIDKILLAEAKLTRFTHDFLEFANPFEPKLAPTKINKLIDNSLEVLTDKIEKANVKVSKVVAENLPEIMVDSDRIGQVILNLVANAIEAMRDTRRELKISVRVIDNQSMIEMKFQDTGCGIMEENIPKLFTPFYSTKTTGTGLGLAIAHKIIEAHQGRIIVESKLNQGTTFTVYLKLIPDHSG